MMKQKELVPKRRFKGFTDEWKICKYNDLLDKSEGIRRGPFGSALKKECFVPNSDYVVYEQQNAIYDRYNTRYNITKQKYEELYRFILNEDDFIMSGAGTIGRISRVPSGIKSGVINQALIKMRVNKYLVDLDYFLQWMRSEKMQNRLTQANPASAMVNLVPMSEVKEREVTVQSIEEQQKIGQYLKHLDEMNAREKRKFDKIKALKSAYLAEMFPAEGECVPKRRFEGYTVEWKDYKMKDIGKATGGTSIESEFVKEGKYKVISIGSYSEQSVYTDQNIRVNLSDKIKKRVLNKNDLTMILNDKTVSGNIIGRVLLIDKDDAYVYNQRTARIEPDNRKFDIQFLYQFLNAPLIRKKIINQAQGNTQIYVNWTRIEELQYSIPILEEQIKIGDFFRKLDATITNHQRKLDKLRATKQAYLHEMFV